MPLQIVRQDITKMHVDAIVNTTNEKLIGYSGVDLAIHTIAGAELDAECAKLAPLGLGQAKLSGAYGLPCKYVIHTSGPVWRGGLVGESIILRSCYIESLKLAVKSGCRSVAFPLISSGVYGYPKDQVLKFAIQTITEFLFDHELNVYICVFDKESYSFSQKLFNEIRAFIDDDYVGTHSDDAYDASCSEPEFPVSADREARKRREVTRTPLFYRSVEPMAVSKSETLDEYMRSMDKPFAYKLFDLIDRSGMTDVECYKKANIDKKTFSKIKCNPKTYKPSKQTAVAFAIALRLDLDATQELLASAGLTLSHSFVFDKIICYFIRNEVYDIFEINEALFAFDQMLLGSL